MADLNANASGSSARESFDWYASIGDAANGAAPLWHSSTSWQLTTGRFSGSRAFTSGIDNAVCLDMQSTGSNDSRLIFRFGFIHTAPFEPGGTDLGLGIQFLDGTTPQCTIMFRSDGAIIVLKGDVDGPIEATITNVYGQNTWVGLQGEIKVHDSDGLLKLWKSGQIGVPGSITPDHEVSGIETTTTANDYTNNVRLVTGDGMAAIGAGVQRIDDLHIHNLSGDVPNSLVGDLRAEQLLPSADVSVQFDPVPAEVSFRADPFAVTVTIDPNKITAHGSSLNEYDGVFTKIRLLIDTPRTGNIKCAIYLNDGTLTGGGGNAPGTLVATTNEITDPAAGWIEFTVSGTPAAVKNNSYFVAVLTDASFGVSSTLDGSYISAFARSQTYGSGFTNPLFVGLAPTPTESEFAYEVYVEVQNNFSLVNEPQEDGLLSYVKSRTIGDTDTYELTDPPTEPVTIDAIVVVAFMGKNDAGSRTGQVHLVSGGTSVDTPAVAVQTTLGFYRTTYTLDPDTAVAWTAAAVDDLQLGPKVAG